MRKEKEELFLSPHHLLYTHMEKKLISCFVVGIAAKRCLTVLFPFLFIFTPKKKKGKRENGAVSKNEEGKAAS